MTMKGTAFLAVVLTAAQVFAAEAPSLKTPLQRQSYGLGVDMGKNLKRQGAEMDPDIVIKGLKDGMSGGKLQMSDEELFSTMKSFAAERRAKQHKDQPGAQEQENMLKTGELETLYALGLVLNRQLAVFNLSAAELALVKQGLSDAAAGRGPEVDLAPFNEKINELARARRLAQGERVAALNAVFLAQAAAEKGALKSDSGLIFLPLKEGSGAKPGPADSVKVHYRGSFPDGNEFANSYKKGEPIELKLDGAIKCWNEGLQKMNVGGKAKLYCPPELGYGEVGAGDLILPKATLVFEVELLEVKR
jgi:FKBP-type peptidyl-prolyl cis-trans isomerase